MTDSIVLHSPFDAHLHLRQGDLMRRLVPLSAATFAAAVVMPNTDPPIMDCLSLVGYRESIYAESPENDNFKPFVTAYFNTSYTRHDLVQLCGHGMLAVKFYPRGLTTNARHGCDPDDPAIEPVLATMEDLGIPLCVHAEAPGYYEDREYLFGKILDRWIGDFPKLKIVVEHISDERTLEFLYHSTCYGTVTPHHLLLTGDDWVGPPLRPHLYCMPVAKRLRDRDALVEAVTVSDLRHKLMLGTDSAPHPILRKEAADCYAGIFHAPIALQLVADVFDRAGCLDRLQAFISGNARRIYGLELPAKDVTLVRWPFRIPERYGVIVPMWAGREIPWSVQL